MTVHASNLMPSAHPERSAWIQKLARAGFAAKGVIYGLIGILAASAALGEGGQVGGKKEAVQTIGQGPFGTGLLAIIGIGLLGYALWRFLEAALDARHVGSSSKGLLKRVGYAGSGVVNGAIGVLALQLAFGLGARAGQEGTYVAKLMAQPFGQVLVAVLGVVAIGVGIHQIREGYTKAFMRKLDISSMSPSTRPWVMRSAMAGLVARGVIFAIVGVFLIKAAIEHHPGTAVGIGGALRTIASQPWGMVLLLVTALGLIGYGVYQLVMAKYARLPEPG